MTDNEIIKAEKVIKDLHAYCFCSQSVFKKMGYNFTESDFDCVNNLFHIIDRQEAIIEKSEKVEHFADKTIETANAEIDKLEKELMKCKLEKEMLYQTVEEIKSEAIKEFAERFAKALSEFDMSSVGLPDYDRGYKDCMTAIEDTIDSLVKMTEVQK